MTWETIRNLVRDEWVILSLLLFWSLAGLTVICADDSKHAAARPSEGNP